MSNPSTITIELVNEPGQRPWWRASFGDYHGFGPHPADALDNLLACITTSVLTKPETPAETPKAAQSPVRFMQTRLSS